MIRWKESEIPLPFSVAAGPVGVVDEPEEKKGNKYRAIATEVDGIKFDSGKEARRYMDLKLLERAGEIRDLRWQTTFSICIGEFHICDYICDFEYWTKDGHVVEDVKSDPTRTPVYRLKKKLMQAVRGIEIQEV